LFLTIARAFGQDTNDASVVAVGECIDEIAKVDAGSTVFRYARDVKAGHPAYLPMAWICASCVRLWTGSRISSSAVTLSFCIAPKLRQKPLEITGSNDQGEYRGGSDTWENPAKMRGRTILAIAITARNARVC